MANTTFSTSSPVDTHDPGKVERALRDLLDAAFPGEPYSPIDRIFADLVVLFRGQDSRFLPLDLEYHDLEHTMQATLCAARIVAGRSRANAMPPLDAHHFRLTVVAGLLHDTGYLKTRGDTEGTGAKYTATHVRRSAEFAVSYLGELSWPEADIRAVQHAILCTGPQNRFVDVPFHDDHERIIASALVSGDYLGQMSDDDYIDALPVLYREFLESDEFNDIPEQQRVFPSEEALIRNTPEFWSRLVLPKLENECQGIYRFLAEPYPGGPNPYIRQIESNIEKLKDRLVAD